MGTPVFPNDPSPALLNDAKVVGDGGLINGVFGSSKTQTGVIGLSERGIGVSGDGAQNGVVGFSRTGIGVFGESPDGIGINGKGGRLAGRFEGNVEVTGDVSVQGHSMIQVLQRIEELENRMRRLVKGSENQRFGITGGKRGRLTVKPFGPFHLKIAGADFTPNTSVLVRMGNRVGLIGDVHFETNAHGEFAEQQMELNIQVLRPIFIAATDGRIDDSDLTGLFWSDTVTFNN